MIKYESASMYGIKTVFRFSKQHCQYSSKNVQHKDAFHYIQFIQMVSLTTSIFICV